MKDIEDRKQLAENKKKNKEVKQSAKKEKQDNCYHIQVFKNSM